MGFVGIFLMALGTIWVQNINFELEVLVGYPLY